MTPLRLLFLILAAAAYLAVSFTLLRGIAPALVSSRDSLMVAFGFAIPVLWLAASASTALHLFNQHRAQRETTRKENHQ